MLLTYYHEHKTLLVKSLVLTDAAKTLLAESTVLTDAAKTLLAEAHQHRQAAVAVSWLVEVFQSPRVRPVVLDILEQRPTNKQ